MNKKQLQQVKKVIEYAQVFMSKPELITEQITIDRYNEVLEQNGKEAADQALTKTVEVFKKRAKETENIQLTKLKNKMFDSVGWCPSSLREIKRMKDSGELEKYITV